MTDTCNVQCGLFDFMANEIGIKVLHPGGYKSTGELCKKCKITESSTVLDLACGVGTTSFYLQDRFGCKVTGVDIDENLISIAKKALMKKVKKDKITFKVANALELPFPDNTFDVMVSQAFFILIDEKEKALEEVSRVLKPGGSFGSLELSWFKVPPQDAYNELVTKTCNDFIPRVSTFGDWEKLFASQDLIHIDTSKHPMDSGMSKMLQSEGLANFTRIMYRVMRNSQARKRMMNVQAAFRKHKQYLGYGIYSYEKPMN